MNKYNWTQAQIETVDAWLAKNQTKRISPIIAGRDDFRVEFKNGRQWTFYVSTVLSRYAGSFA